ncbi:NADH dehydrogenase ubiquinone Fe-S protein 4 [Gymnodinialimonas sp. 57CJ19]|uniref:NADH dehydrogenase ubiquinone Fe-S protein 4 n=1 Tax=Gymnodinialimonas sp. 57CJ19 TaxID=3138498 RepID=UPI0031344D48
MSQMKGHNRPPLRPTLPGTDLTSTGVPTAIIYRPAKSATQSGPRPDHWLLKFVPASGSTLEPLMGWTSSDDPYQTINLSFPDRESAIAYAADNDWRYRVTDD